MSQKPRLAPAVLKLLATGYVGTTHQLAERVFGHETAVRRSVKQLQASGQVRVTDWVKSYQMWIPVWGSADGLPDEVKPKPLPKLEVHRAFKLRHPDKDGRKKIVSEWLAQLKAMRRPAASERKKHS